MNFERFSHKAGDFVLIEGGFEQDKQWEQFDFSEDELKNILKKKIVRLEFEEPNKFFIGDNPDSYDRYFYKIFTLCPYTAKWLNKRQKTKKHVPIFYPFNEKYIPPKKRKKYDVIFAGHIVSKKIAEDLDAITAFNYCFVSNSDNHLVTHKGSSHKEKLNLYAQSRIALVHNVLFPKFYHILNIWRMRRFKENEAFKMIPKPREIIKLLKNRPILVPQLKARLFEAAFTRSLILCRRDPFNIIENFFIPEKEFIYFEDGHLQEKISEILMNYSKYEKVADRAYKKAIKNYTTKAFFDKYLKNI